MKRMIIASVAAVAAFAIPSSAQVSNGSQATNFRLTDVNGDNVALSDFKGRLVVLRGLVVEHLVGLGHRR